MQNTEDIETEELWERWRCEVDKGQGKERIDKYLAEHMTNTSRNRIQNAADAGNVWVNGQAVASNYKVKPGDVIQVLLDHEPNSKLPELDWLTETLSNCTSEQRQTVIELSKVYLRSL